uniref:Cytochrome P450 n=1 Tax=Kalanchoe fedtschenkoi TaxID=63787 RepID=A0A7N0UZL3_KALFE
MAILFYDSSIMSPMILALLLLASLGCLFGLARRRQQCRPLTPWRLPVIGNFHQLTSLPHRGLHNLSQIYGRMMIVYFGSAPYFVISSADLAREVTKTHDYHFSNRVKSTASRLLFAGSDDLVFSPNSHFRRQAKKLCVNELLSTKRVQSFYYIIEEEVAELVAKIRFSCQDGHSDIDLSSLFIGVANNIVCRAVLGQKCTDGGNGDGTMGELVKEATELLTAFSFGDFFPFLAWLDSLVGFNKKGIQISQALHEFLDRVIDEHEIQPPACRTEDGENNRKDFVQIITELQKNDMSGLQFTRDNIKAILLDMFLAGTDTSAASMEWTMAELAKHPRIMKKVQDEVQSVVGEQPKITEHHINRMKYLHCVVKESLRLHAPFILGRQTFTDLTLGGFKIPANSSALINSWAIHRDPLIWDRPLEFLPERFMDRSSDYKGQDHNYIPFGQGRRSCPGAHFSVSEIEYALANLLFWFNWELPDGMAAEELDMSETAAQVSHKKLPLRLVPVPKAV